MAYLKFGIGMVAWVFVSYGWISAHDPYATIHALGGLLFALWIGFVSASE